jgi:hypothetical protein
MKHQQCEFQFRIIFSLFFKLKGRHQDQQRLQGQSKIPFFQMLCDTKLGIAKVLLLLFAFTIQ